MAKRIPVIFDRLESSGEKTRDVELLGSLVGYTEYFKSSSIAICGYKTITRLSPGTVLIKTKREAFEVVGTYDSVLNDFRKATNLSGSAAYIVSRDMVNGLASTMPDLATQYEKNLHKPFALAGTVHRNIETLQRTSQEWRAGLGGA